MPAADRSVLATDKARRKKPAGAAHQVKVVCDVAYAADWASAEGNCGQPQCPPGAAELAGGHVAIPVISLACENNRQ